MNNKSQKITNRSQIIIATTLGAIFVIFMLIFIILIPLPTSYQFWAFRVIFALSVAAIASILSGSIYLENKFFKLTGPLAVFIVVLFLKIEFYPFDTYLENPDIQIRIQQLEKKNINLQQNYDRLQEKSNNLQENYNDLQGKNNNLLQKYSNLQQRDSDLLKEYDNLQEKDNDLKKNYNSLQKKYNGLKDEYNNLSNKITKLNKTEKLSYPYENYESARNTLNEFIKLFSYINGEDNRNILNRIFTIYSRKNRFVDLVVIIVKIIITLFAFASIFNSDGDSNSIVLGKYLSKINCIFFDKVLDD